MQTDTPPAATESASRRWRSIKGAADHLDVTPRTIAQMIADGHLPAYRLGPKTVRIDLNELDASLPLYSTQETAVRSSSRDELTDAALQVLAAVKANVIDNDPEAMLRRLRGSSREVSLRLAEATNLVAHLVKMSDRPEQMLAALIETVTNVSTTD